MSTGLHVRKKPLNQEDDPDSEALNPPSKGDRDDSDKKMHGQTSFLRRLVRSEIGCAIEAIVGFLLFGLLFGYMILHHQHRKVRCKIFLSIDCDSVLGSVACLTSSFIN